MYCYKHNTHSRYNYCTQHEKCKPYTNIHLFHLLA